MKASRERQVERLTEVGVLLSVICLNGGDSVQCIKLPIAKAPIPSAPRLPSRSPFASAASSSR